LADPLFGRSAGIEGIRNHVDRLGDWLLERGAVYERQHFTSGADRDASEGVLSLSLESKTVELPLAVVAEKRRNREVEVRLYFCSQPVRGEFVPRAPLVPRTTEAPVPTAVAAFLEHLAKGRVEELTNAFELKGSVREARGVSHDRSSGAMKEYFERLLAGGAFGGTQWSVGGMADDDRACAVEYTLVRSCGRDVDPQAGLAVFERGDSGLFRSLRLYDDVES
jgi:hypothetical protein